MRRIENLLVLKFKNKRPLMIIFYAIKENKDMVGEVKELASIANMIEEKPKNNKNKKNNNNKNKFSNKKSNSIL